MKKKEIGKLFFSTLLLFIVGFILVFITENLIEFKNYLFFISTRLIIMILSGALLFFIINLKFFLKKRHSNIERSFTYIKWRGFFISLLSLVSIYFMRNRFRKRDFISSVLKKINNIFFHLDDPYSIVDNYDMVTMRISTILFILIMITTYLLLEFSTKQKK